jgi:hypothetical protein
MSRERVIHSSHPRQDAINFVSDHGKHHMVFGKWLDAGPPNGSWAEHCRNSHVPRLHSLASSHSNVNSGLSRPRSSINHSSPSYRSTHTQKQRKASWATLPKQARASPSVTITTSPTPDPMAKGTTSTRSWGSRRLPL